MLSKKLKVNDDNSTQAFASSFGFPGVDHSEPRSTWLAYARRSAGSTTRTLGSSSGMASRLALFLG